MASGFQVILHFEMEDQSDHLSLPTVDIRGHNSQLFGFYGRFCLRRRARCPLQRRIQSRMFFLLG